MKKIQFFIATALLFCTGIYAQDAGGIFKAAGSPANPKVVLSWNHYNDYKALAEICKKIAAAYPHLAKLQSIGKSHEGRDIWCLAVTDYKIGNADKKPGMYIDGNIHSNEVQGSEFALYTAWYLTESFSDTKFIQELLADKIFYIVPTINPDGRDHFFHKANNASSPRSGTVPIDNDRDGLVNEDGYDDLDGDGFITQMRRKTPSGRFRTDPSNPGRLIQVGPEENGEYEFLGLEGKDNDGDGQVNEDGEEFEYDPNRDWGWNWQPNFIQSGAYKYPFSLPENRAVMNFVMQHPNIAAAQTYHNSGGMILRGPGAIEDVGTYNQQDVQIYDILGRKGEELIPGYRYLVVYRDLYSVYGGELDWFYGSRGVYCFSNELFTPYLYYQRDSVPDNAAYSFNRNLLFNDAFVEWKEFDHPQYGKIEIGGFKKNYGRAHPGFLLESDAHRNMAFTIYHAYHTPKLSVDQVKEKDLGGGLTEVTAIIINTRLMPTHSNQDRTFKIERPDYVSLDGANVISSMIVNNPDLGIATEQRNGGKTVEVENIPGLSKVVVRWIIQKTGKYSITVDSNKGGIAGKLIQ